jgi:modulator of DNA gyrase family protein
MQEQKKQKLKADGYLNSVEPLVIKLIEFLTNNDEYEIGCDLVRGCGFREASVLAVNSKSKKYSISRAGMNIADDAMFCTRGFVIRVFDGTLSAEYSCSEIGDDSFVAIGEALENIIGETKKRMNINQQPECVPETKHAAETEYFTEYEIHPEEMGDDAILSHLDKIRSKTLACDENVMDCSVVCSYRRLAKRFLRGADGKILEQKEQNILWMTSAAMVLVARGEEIKDYYKGYSNLGGAEVLAEMEADVENNVKCAVALLDSEPIVPGEYECICTPDVTGMIVHEAFGHGVEMDMFVKKRALAEQYIGESVASPLVTMHDGAVAAQQTASYLFDDEGTDAQDTIIIEKGILKRGISDLRSAARLGTQPTGNGRRESYKRKAYTRMTNTFFEAGTDKVEDMIASVKYGFLLENARSGMEDPKNWGIQCMVNIAREIKDGEFTGKIFSPIVLTGYVPDLLKSISMISDKVELGGGGYCGKGYKEWVKVSDGGPYIKARIRLG